MATGTGKKSVLFICLGNICRSPMAEAVFIDVCRKAMCLDQWHIDSAGIIDYHLGKPPDRRTTKVLQENEITDYKHLVRRVKTEDFESFDYIFGMDRNNIDDLQNLMRKSKKPKAQIDLFGKYDPEGELIIEDPYYGDDINDFRKVYEQCLRCSEGFLNHLKNKN